MAATPAQAPQAAPAVPTSAPAPAAVKVVVLGTASDAGMYVADER